MYIHSISETCTRVVCVYKRLTARAIGEKFPVFFSSLALDHKVAFLSSILVLLAGGHMPANVLREFDLRLDKQEQARVFRKPPKADLNKNARVQGLHPDRHIMSYGTPLYRKACNITGQV